MHGYKYNVICEKYAVLILVEGYFEERMFV